MNAFNVLLDFCYTITGRVPVDLQLGDFRIGDKPTYSLHSSSRINKAMQLVAEDLMKRTELPRPMDS